MTMTRKALAALEAALGMRHADPDHASRRWSRRSLRHGRRRTCLRAVTAQWPRALEAAPKLELCARSINTKDTQGLGRAFAGTEKITGGKLPVDQELALLREVIASVQNMAKEDTIDAFRLSAGPMATKGGLSGVEGLQQLGGMLSVLGAAYGEQPRKIQSAMEQILDVFQAQMDNPELKASLHMLGVDTTNAGTMFRSMLPVLERTPSAFAGISMIPDDLVAVMRGAAENMARFDDAAAAITGNVKALAADLARAKNSPAAAFATTIELLKGALEPLIGRLAAWLSANTDKVEAFARFLARLGGLAAEHGEAILALFAGLALQPRMMPPPGLSAPGGGGGPGGMMMPPVIPAGGGGCRTPMPPRRGSQAWQDVQAGPRAAAGSG